MKVVILNTSDTKGGAAVVSFRLMKALRGCGIDARMLVATGESGDPYVAKPEQLQRYAYKYAFYKERAGIFACNGFSRENLFKVSTASSGIGILSHPWVKEADVVCLNWINQGFLSLAGIERLAKSGKKIVWTMHDMWCCTGICHHAYSCMNYLQSCGNCSYLGKCSGKNDLSHRTWQRKKRLYDSAGIKFVAVSNWLAGCCRKSSLLAGKDISVVNNPIPVEKFGYERTGSTEEAVIGMGAARLDDPVKGFELLAEATALLAQKSTGTKFRLILFGAIRNRELLSSIRIPYEWLGPVAIDDIPQIYRRCDIIVSSSHFETLPTTLIEGQAAGCLAVAFDHGGQKDIIDHSKNGYLARYPDTADLANGIIWAAGACRSIDRRELHQSVEQRFSTRAIAEEYIKLFAKPAK